MDGKTSAGKLIKVTEYGKQMPPATPPLELSAKKEMRRMQTEADNLNEAEKISPNPVYNKKTKQSTGKKGTLAMGAYPTEGVNWDDIDEWFKRHFPQIEKPPTSKEEVDKFLAAVAKTGTSESEDAISGMLNDYASGLRRPVFKGQPSPAYRFPGYFNG